MRSLPGGNTGERRTSGALGALQYEPRQAASVIAYLSGHGGESHSGLDSA